MTAGILGAGLTPPPPVGTVPPLPPLGAVPVEVDKEIDLVEVAILSVGNLGSWSQLLILIKTTSKILSVGNYFCNLPCYFFLFTQWKREGLPQSCREASRQLVA